MRRPLSLAIVVLAGLVTSAGAADPARAGRLAVGVATVDAVDTSRGRTIPTDVWYPAETAGRDAALLPRAYPLILVAHGYCGARTNYEYLTTHLASHGFVVAAPDLLGYTRGDCASGDFDQIALDLSFVCRTLHDTTGPLAPYAQHVRGLPTGLVGHSLGGAMVVGATRIDPAFTATVGLAPAVRAGDAAGLPELSPRRAWLVVGGTADELVSFTGWTEPFWEGLPRPAFLVRITGGTHGGFSDADAGLTDAIAEQQAIVKRHTTAFFVRYLARKARYGKRLRPGDDGTVAIRARK
jgi:predicted dienelactone hydrolase